MVLTPDTVESLKVNSKVIDSIWNLIIEWLKYMNQMMVNYSQIHRQYIFEFFEYDSKFSNSKFYFFKGKCSLANWLFHLLYIQHIVTKFYTWNSLYLSYTIKQDDISFHIVLFCWIYKKLCAYIYNRLTSLHCIAIAYTFSKIGCV